MVSAYCLLLVTNVVHYMHPINLLEVVDKFAKKTSSTNAAGQFAAPLTATFKLYLGPKVARVVFFFMIEIYWERSAEHCIQTACFKRREE